MTKNINITFCRHMLAMAHADIRKAFPRVNVNGKDTIGVCGPTCGQYFVEIRVGGYPAFDHYYEADNVYDAKAKAWRSFFDKYAPEQIKREVA